MNLFETLKHFKKIAPDPAFSATSKRAILAYEPAMQKTWSVRRVLFAVIETGAAVALTGFFVLLITGMLSDSRLTPQYSAVDATALHAEAQAIDMQIQLANLSYVPPTTQSTVPTAGVKQAPSASSPVTPAPAAPSASATTTSTPTTTVSIDQALQGLSK